MALSRGRARRDRVDAAEQVIVVALEPLAFGRGQSSSWTGGAWSRTRPGCGGAAWRDPRFLPSPCGPRGGHGRSGVRARALQAVSSRGHERTVSCQTFAQNARLRWDRSAGSGRRRCRGRARSRPAQARKNESGEMEQRNERAHLRIGRLLIRAQSSGESSNCISVTGSSPSLLPWNAEHSLSRLPNALGERDSQRASSSARAAPMHRQTSPVSTALPAPATWPTWARPGIMMDAPVRGPMCQHM
jgi:hypothetical protein